MGYALSEGEYPSIHLELYLILEVCGVKMNEEDVLDSEFDAACTPDFTRVVPAQ